MKKVLFTLMCLVAMLAAGTNLKAQEVTITILPGYTWISYPGTDTLDFATAMGTFVPMSGDVIQSQWGNSRYVNGQWRGSISQFYPGYGYIYKSTRTTPVLLTFNAQQPMPQVVVTTLEPTEITAVSAVGGGTVTTVDGNYVPLDRGICWSLSPNPTFNDNYIEVGSGIGSFTVSMTELDINTTYYVRAYAVTEDGTFYGEQKTFITRDGIPTLTTTDITNIGRVAATGGGYISDDGGLSVTARGVCWSVNPDPTINDNCTIDGMDIGSFSSGITGLNGNTTYDVRAYATNSSGTNYGNEIVFTTLEQTWPNGVSPGVFSVSANSQVHFSQGNLQYRASTNTWRFAENQYDYVGSANSNISSSYSGWIDLFGWGTSGWNNGNTYYHPWDHSTASYGVYYGPDGQYNLTGSYANADWGVYNPISNGGNAANMWRTLTKWEWSYVFESRSTTSGIRYAKAQVNNINGVILLPDNWSNDIYHLNNKNSKSASFSSNIISAAQWITLESAGAVFLPAAGERYGVAVSNVGSKGSYWSTSYYHNNVSYYEYFNNSDLDSDNRYRSYGFSVRLVQ